MDSDESDDELYPIVVENPEFRFGEAFVYNDPLLVSGILRAVVEEDLEKIKELVSTGYSLNINDNNGNTPLHVAVIKNNLEILNFILNQDHTDLNYRNSNERQTPLYIAVKNGYFELAKLLIDRGADVNLPDDKEVTPLHRSVQFPNITHMLIKNGANINAVDCIFNNTPLHNAVCLNCLETVCMLLYYGAETNVLDCCELTPFMKAVITKNVEIQEILFEYVDDCNVTTFDGISLLSLALTHDSPFLKEILRRGAQVDISAVKASIRLNNPSKFKLILSLLKLDEIEHFNILNYIYSRAVDRTMFLSHINIFVEYSDPVFFESLAETITNNMYMNMLLNWSGSKYLSKDEITKLTCLLLEYGFQPDAWVVMTIYQTMGYCELFKILLHLDYKYNWHSIYDITPRLIFDVHSDIETVCQKLKEARIIINSDMLQIIESSLKYWVHPSLMDRVLHEYHEPNFRIYEDLVAHKIEIALRLSDVPKVPRLLQLARDQMRKYIVNKFKMESACQYYTFINHMEISDVYKKILSFETPIYKFKFH